MYLIRFLKIRSHFSKQFIITNTNVNSKTKHSINIIFNFISNFNRISKKFHTTSII